MTSDLGYLVEYGDYVLAIGILFYVVTYAYVDEYINATEE
jgi:hypothetical protein